METIFFTPENKEKLLSICKTWEGTDYFHMGICKNGGVDCAKLIGFIFDELGCSKEQGLESYYPRDWFIHGDE